MEYDNDRKILPPHRQEIYSWILLALLNPVINTFTFFWWEPLFGLVLLFISLLTMPIYLLFARNAVEGFLFKKKPIPFAALCILFFTISLLLQTGISNMILNFPLNPQEKFYFTTSTRTLARESMWIIVNLFLATSIAYLKKFFEERELLRQVQKDNTQFKLKYLQSQLNPHFLFNTLNSIYSLSLQKSDKAPEVIVQLADIMRYLIDECNEPRVPLDKEIEFIRNYIEIEKIRYNADVQFTIEGITSGIMIEPFLFISFVENGFKHAMSGSCSNPFIYVTLKINPGQIVLNVVNNTDFDLETQAKRINGTGIKNSKSLLELLYPDAYALDIIQTEIQGRRSSDIRLRNARERLKMLYPDSHTLDVILSNNAFTVSLIVNPHNE
jgi:LytS/YehU family sensor histidine kinase